jgi:hypothetical protein
MFGWASKVRVKLIGSSAGCLVLLASSALALDWQSIVRGDNDPLVAAYITSCVEDSVNCYSVAGQTPEICTAQLTTCEENAVSAYDPDQGIFGIDHTGLTTQQLADVRVAYDASDTAKGTCYSDFMGMLDDYDCMNKGEVGSPEFLQCLWDNEIFQKRSGCYASAAQDLKTALNGVP